MNGPADETFRESYGMFDVCHAEQRQELLTALPTGPRRLRRRRPAQRAAALAAALVVAAGIAGVALVRSTPAYGIEGVRERLLSLRSLHLKGWQYQRDTTEFGVATLRFPVERYYQRPSRSYNVGYGFSSNGNDDLVRVTSSASANDGERSIALLHDQKRAILTPSDPLDAELSVERGLQISEVERLINGLPEDYQRVGTELVDGAWCDIYQSKVDDVGGLQFWRRLWIDPTSGLPVRVLGMKRHEGEEAEPFYEYTEIHANVDPPAELFSFEAPAGYEVTKIEAMPRPAGIWPTSSGSAGSRQVAEYVGLGIDDRAMLVCWSQWTQEGGAKVWFKDPPSMTFDGAGSRACKATTLYETTSGDVRWRWSLVRPRDGRPIGADGLTIQVSHGREGTVMLNVQPLAFADAQLSEMVDRVQRRSLEAGGDFGPIKSLAELREMFADEESGARGE
jgi:hypothetical protein